METMLDIAILLLVSPQLLRAAIKETLEHQGYSVFDAGNLGTAVERLKVNKQDLLIISPYLEDISGYDAANFLRTKCPGLPVLVMGGIMDDDRIQTRIAIQGFELFPKPFTAAELIQKVKDTLQKVR
jgi:DNA-binding NtrC family response regulator